MGVCGNFRSENSCLPPDKNAEEDFEVEEIRKEAERDSVGIMGDFKYLHIDWVNAFLGHNKERKFLDMQN